MSAAKPPWWRRTPWWVAVTVGFFASIAGQWIINDLVALISPETPDLTFWQQGGLAGGAVLAAAGTALIGKGAPERPENMGRWKDFWWGPVMVMFSAAVLLLSLLCVWVIPEAVTAFKEEGASLEGQVLIAVVLTSVVIGALALSIGLTLHLRRSAMQVASEEGAAPVIPEVGEESKGSERKPSGAGLWVVALLIVVAVLTPASRDTSAPRDRS